MTSSATMSSNPGYNDGRTQSLPLRCLWDTPPGTLKVMCHGKLSRGLWEGFSREAIAKLRFCEQELMIQGKKPRKEIRAFWAEPVQRSRDERESDIFLHMAQQDDRGEFKRRAGRGMSQQQGTCGQSHGG